MANSTTGSRTSASKPLPRKKAPHKPTALEKGAVRSATKTTPSKPRGAPRAVPKAATPTRPAVTKPLDSSPLFVALRVEEQLAVKQALAGQRTVLTSSPRARDSAIFAAAASIARQPVLVVSPLAAELVEHAALLPGLDVAAFGTFVSPDTAAASKRRWERGGPLLVVVEPAQLFDPTLRAVLAKAPLSLVGIAAAHACSEHAHELSPAYLSLAEALPAFEASVLATCTATSARVVQEVAKAIGAHPECVVEARGPELLRSAQVVRASERKSALTIAIEAHGAPGVVLTATPQEADAVYAELSTRRVPCVRAHAGMAPGERTAALRRFTDMHEKLVLVTQSPHANATGLAGCPEVSYCLGSVAPRPDLAFVIHFQAPLSLEQLFEDLAWLAPGKSSLVLADSSDEALVQALLAQQRIKPAAIEAMAHVVAQLPDERAAGADTLALRAGTSRRSAERVLGAFADRNLVVRDGAQVTRRVSPEELRAEGLTLSARFASLRAGDVERAQQVARYVTSRHVSAPAATQAPEAATVRYARA